MVSKTGTPQKGDTGAEVPGFRIGSPGTWVPGSEPVRRDERLRLPCGAGSLRSFRPIPILVTFLTLQQCRYCAAAPETGKLARAPRNHISGARQNQLVRD